MANLNITHHHHHHHITLLYSPSRAAASPFCGFLTITFLQEWIVSQAPKPPTWRIRSPCMTPGDRMAQLHPPTLGTHFSLLSRHAWVTVGLFFNPGHYGTVILLFDCNY
jgi:hypothetical protein